MALIATRIDTKRFNALPDAPDFAVECGAVVVLTEWWDHPLRQISLLLKKTTTVFSGVSNVPLRREINEWLYEDGIVGEESVPTRMHTTIEATLYLPKISDGTSMMLVEERWTRYWMATMWYSGPRSSQTITEGYVIHEQTPVAYNVADAAASLTAEKRKVPAAAKSTVVVDSMRRWSTAMNQRAVVKKPAGAPQTTIWQEIEIENVTVEEDWLVRREWTERFDRLTGEHTVDGPHETAKKPAFESTIDILAPIIPADGEVIGPNQHLESAWPHKTKVRLAIDRFSIYRHTKTSVARTPDGDPMGIYLTPPGAPAVTQAPAITSVTTNLGGTPADPVPPLATLPTEGGDDSIPDVERWEQIADVPNIFAGIDRIPYGQWTDAHREPGFKYEYVATARIRENESPRSPIFTFQTPGIGGGTGLAVFVRTRADGGVDIDLQAPQPLNEIDARSPDTSVTDQYGETLVLADVPIAVETPADAEALGLEIGQRQFTADRPTTTLVLTPVAPILTIDRGVLVRVAPGTWTTRGNGLVMTQGLAAATWRVEGFSISARRSGERVEVEAGAITAESVG